MKQTPLKLCVAKINQVAANLFLVESPFVSAANATSEKEELLLQ